MFRAAGNQFRSLLIFDEEEDRKPFYNFNAPQDLEPRYLFKVLEYLRAHRYCFDQSFFQMTCNTNNIESIVAGYFDSKKSAILRFEGMEEAPENIQDDLILGYKKELLEPEFIIDMLKNTKETMNLLKAAHYFGVGYVEHLCYLAVGCSVYLEEGADLDQLLNQLGIGSESYDEKDPEFMHLLERFYKN